MRKKIFLFIVCLMLSTADVSAGEPKISALAAILTEKESGRVLWQKNADKPMPPASTTKIMTAVTVLETIDPDTVITADSEAAAAPKVRMGLENGEKLTARQLLYALMLQSSNDAAIALAKGTCGSTEKFCELMNKKAAELGCTDTHFVTPNGLDADGHHTTAHDMALMAAYALDNAEFVRIIQTKNITFSSNKKSYSIYNHDRFLSEYDGALGIKTGFTGKAGHCFAGAAQRGGTTLVSVVFASGWGTGGKEAKWRDTKALMDYGFKNYKYTQAVNKGALVCDVPVGGGRESTAGLVIGSDFGTALKNGEKYNITCTVPARLSAPVHKGDVLGSARITTSGGFCASVPVIADKDVDKNTFLENFCRLAAFLTAQ